MKEPTPTRPGNAASDTSHGQSAANLDPETVAGFGQEWARFDQTGTAQGELEDLFTSYFRLFPWRLLPDSAIGFDLGCGSGRWAGFVAPKVGRLHCIDASSAALNVARRNLAARSNCEFHLASVDSISLPDGSMDFGYSLGVLHHVPDTAAALRCCVAKLKPDAPFLLYLYYAFDNRPAWYRLLWRATDLVRLAISRAPQPVKYWVTQGIAVFVYYPLARLALLLEKLGLPVPSLPLYVYRNRSLYTMRTDALDRFGTRLEKRFTAAEIRAMMEQAGLDRIAFMDAPPYWCAVGQRKPQ